MNSLLEVSGVTVTFDGFRAINNLSIQISEPELRAVIGPNGAGKEKIAEIIQANSSCKAGPFVRVNAGALPADLIEAELFGTSSGALPGPSHGRVDSKPPTAARCFWTKLEICPYPVRPSFCGSYRPASSNA